MELVVDNVEVKKHQYNKEHSLYSFVPLQRESKLPLLLFFPGGGWKKCDPLLHFAQCFLFAKLGIVACVVEYSVNGILRIDYSMDDAYDALVYTTCEDSDFEYTKLLDLKKICVMGNSAGGQVAASLLLCTSMKHEAYQQPTIAILYAPVLNLLAAFRDKSEKLPEDERTKGFEELKKWCPRENIKRGKPPILALHGKEDQAVPFEYTKEFEQLYHHYSNQFKLIEYEGYNHCDWYYGNPYFTYDKNMKNMISRLSSEKAKREVPGEFGTLFSISAVDTIKYLIEKKFVNHSSPHTEEDLLALLQRFDNQVFAKFS